jgi:SPOR domain
MSMTTSFNNFNSSVNRNLSSLLSQIQDDGPAYADAMKQSNPDNVATNNNAKTDAAYVGAHKQQDAAVKPAISKKEISPGVWLQLLLLLISAALLVSTLFRLDAQTSDLEKSLSDYDEQIQESIDFQNEQVPAGTTKIKKTLQALQKDLKLIKTDYSALDKKYVEMAANTAVPQTVQATQAAALVQDNIRLYEDEISALKSELKTVRNELSTINQGDYSIKQMVANNGLIVSLASFTSKYNAEKIAKQLHADGLVPAIKQAVVRGERVYRLSVSGFLNRNEAETFIRKAGTEYGMTDGRIRKS